MASGIKREPREIDGRNTWECIYCGEWKSEDSFGKNCKASNGLTSVCKDCRIEYSKKYKQRPATKTLNRKYKKELYHSAKGEANRAANKGKQRAWCAEYKARNKAKVSAQLAIRGALRNRTMTRGNCAHCGTSKRVEGHHPDYSKPLEVVWLCRPDHKSEHRRLRELEEINEQG